MPTPTFQLTGSALTGIGHRSMTAEYSRLIQNLPQQVKLGRKQTKARPQALRMSNYANALAKIDLPTSVDWYTKAATSIAQMYLNATYGDCVMASSGHAYGVWAANDKDSGAIPLATDQEIYNQYQSVCGPGDNGCYIPDVLNYMRDKGMTLGGKSYKIKGYVACDWRSKELVQLGIARFGCAKIGFNLPVGWLNSAVWSNDTAGNQIAGGHDVLPCGYGPPAVVNFNADGVVVASWGRLYLFEWNAFTSSQWIDELYFMVPDLLWTGTDGLDPLGEDQATLLADLAKMGTGDLPPLPGPTPPPPPPVQTCPAGQHWDATAQACVADVPPPPPPVQTFPNYSGPIVATVHLPIFGTQQIVGTVSLKPVPNLRMAGPKEFSFTQIWTIVEDLLAIAAAYRAGDMAGAIAAGLKLLKDLGINLPGQ